MFGHSKIFGLTVCMQRFGLWGCGLSGFGMLPVGLLKESGVAVSAYEVVGTACV